MTAEPSVHLPEEAASDTQRSVLRGQSQCGVERSRQPTAQLSFDRLTDACQNLGHGHHVCDALLAEDPQDVGSAASWNVVDLGPGGERIQEPSRQFEQM